MNVPPLGGRLSHDFGGALGLAVIVQAGEEATPAG